PGQQAGQRPPPGSQGPAGGGRGGEGGGAGSGPGPRGGGQAGPPPASAPAAAAGSAAAPRPAAAPAGCPARAERPAGPAARARAATSTGIGREGAWSLFGIVRRAGRGIGQCRLARYQARSAAPTGPSPGPLTGLRISRYGHLRRGHGRPGSAGQAPIPSVEPVVEPPGDHSWTPSSTSPR